MTRYFPRYVALILVFEMMAVQCMSQQNTPNRPQTPKPPFLYKQRDAAFTNPADGASFAGTLTIPEGRAPHPAAILIPGSGGADRDGTALGHKPFLVLADYLTRRGIAVLRVDSRKADKYFESTCEDFAADVVAGIAFLKKQPDIDAKRIGVIGHSLGGMVAPMVAARSADAAFVVMMAGLALPVRDIAQTQRGQRMRDKGLPEDEVRRRLDASALLYDRLVAGEDNAELRQEVRELIGLQLPAEMTSAPAQLDAFVEQEMKTIRSPYYKFLHGYDPRKTLRQVKCPVLAVNGSLDQAVDAKANLSEIEKSLREANNADATAIEIFGLNHFFQRAKTGSPLEIGQIEETTSPAVLQLISAWIRQRVGLDR